jgi:hypothetical protein
VVLIRLAAGSPDDSAQENDNEAANHKKDHGRSPYWIGATAPASEYLMTALRVSDFRIATLR